MNFVTSISLIVLGAMFLALLGWGSIRAAWRNCEGRRGVFAALAILAAICSIVAQKPSPDTPTITVDALLRDVGCYATNNVFHAAVTNAPSYAGVDFSDCDLMVYARERASSDAASWFELTPRKKFSQQPADYAIEDATNYNYLVYLDYVPPSPVHTNGVFELYGFVIENEAQGEPDQLAAGFINSRAVPLPFDAEVEYLEGTGTQYIDTGIYSIGGMVRYELDFRPSSAKQQNGVNQGYFGLSNSGSRWFGVAYTTLRSRGVGIGLGQSAIWSGMTAIDRYVVAVSASSATVNGEDVGTPGSVVVARAGNLYLFAVNSVDGSGVSSVTPQDCKVYGLKIYGSGGVLIRDYIAVRKSGVGYMYDRASGQLFGNAGTGAFIVGPDK